MSGAGLGPVIRHTSAINREPVFSRMRSAWRMMYDH